MFCFFFHLNIVFTCVNLMSRLLRNYKQNVAVYSDTAKMTQRIHILSIECLCLLRYCKLDVAHFQILKYVSNTLIQ